MWGEFGERVTAACDREGERIGEKYSIESCAWKQRLQAKGERNSGSENKEK